MPSFTTSDGIEIRYEVRGEGRPVAVCHGGPSNICDTLIQDLAPLTPSRALIFHDYRGSGRSAAAPSDTYTFEQLADDLDELRQHLGYESMPVLAHSMGGFVAIPYALRHPEHCERLVLAAASPCGVGPSMIVPVLRALGPLRTIKMLALAARFLGVWSWRAASTARTAAMYAPWHVTQEARLELRAAVAAAHPGLPVDNDNAAQLLQRMNGLDFRDDLPRIKCRALVLYGSRDAGMVVGGRMLTERLSDVDTYVLPDVGHEVFIEAPDETFGAIERFLSSRS